MTTTTDETTHLRALLAEQTARAERAEAEIAAAYGALTMIDTGGTGTLADRVNDLRALWVRAEAANAELRAALEEAFAIHQRSECAAPPCTCTGFEATRALLSRPDLGRWWASPEDTAQMVGALQMVEGDGEFDSLHEVTRKFVVDVLALLKKGGG